MITIINIWGDDDEQAVNIIDPKEDTKEELKRQYYDSLMKREPQLQIIPNICNNLFR